MTKIFVLLPCIVAASLTLACQSGDPAAPAGDASSSPDATASSGEASSTEVEYEPAYPTEVSSEDLTEEDVAQQETPHSHDGAEPHSHDAEGSDDDHDH